ncbi:MAG TPA: helix-turn-helix domain-containing protein [Acidimicrobiales bacterium]
MVSSGTSPSGTVLPKTSPPGSPSGALTVAEAAGRLGVSRRQVQRLASSGALRATRSPGGALVIDPASVPVTPAARPGRGRPWSPPMAWGALWRLAGLDPSWLTAHQRRRLDGLLDGVEPERLLAAVRHKATVERFVASPRAVEALRPCVAVTDGPADRQGAADLHGYVAPDRLAELTARHPITRHPDGNVVLHVTDVPVTDRAEMPAPVRAVDRGDLVALDDLLHPDTDRPWMTAADVAEAIGEELARGDDDFAFRMLARGVADFRSRRRPADVARFLAPPAPAGTGDERWDTLLAATVRRECRRRGVPAPAWTDVPPLRSWWFPLLASPRLVARTLQRTPVDLSVLGIWLDANALETA